MAYKTSLLKYDPTLQKATWLHHDADEGRSVIQAVSDTTIIEETNKAQFNATDERIGWKGSWHKVASVPTAVWWDWMEKTEMGKDRRALKKLLNDPDQRVWRTRPGRV